MIDKEESRTTHSQANKGFRGLLVASRASHSVMYSKNMPVLTYWQYYKT